MGVQQQVRQPAYEGRIARDESVVGLAHQRPGRDDHRVRQQQRQTLEHAVKTQRAQPFWAGLADEHRRAQRFIGRNGRPRQIPGIAGIYRFFWRAIARSILRGCTDTPNWALIRRARRRA